MQLGTMTETEVRSFNQRYWMAATIVIFFAASVLVYMLIARLLKIDIVDVTTRNWRVLLSIVAVVTGVSVVVLRRVLMSRTMLAEVGKRGPSALMSRLTTVAILCAALGEMIGVLGLVGYIQTGSLDFSTQMGLISLLIIGYSFPRRGEWLKVLSETERG